MNGDRDISSYNPTVKQSSIEMTLVKNDSSIKTPELTTETNYPIKTPKLTWEEAERYANDIIKNKTEGKNIDDILIQIFNFFHPNIGIDEAPVSRDILLKLLKVSLFAIYEVVVPNKIKGYGEIRMEIMPDAKNIIETMPLQNLKTISSNLRKFTTSFDSVIMHIVKREWFLQKNDLCIGSECQGKLSILNLLKLMAMLDDLNLCWYFRTHRDFIKKLKTNPKDRLIDLERERLKAFDYMLRNKWCKTISKDDKANWPIPDTMFTPLLTAINNAKLGNPENLQEINVKEYIDLRKKASGAWFGGRTRKLRRRRTRKGKLRKRKTKLRKLRKR